MLLGAVPCVAGEALLGTGELNALGYFKYWSLDLDMDRGGYVRDAYRIDDSLYVVSENGDIFALHADIGLSRWARNLTESVYRVFEPQHFSSEGGATLAVIATTPRVFILDRYTGDEVKDLTLSASVGSAVVAHGGSLFFGSSDGHLYSMVWNDPRTHEAIFNWKVMAGGPVGATPHLVNGGEDLVFASQNGSVFNCTAGQKILNWDYQADGAIEGEIAVDPESVYVASSDRSLYRLDMASGAPRWRVRFPEPLHVGPVVIGNMVFQYCDTQGVSGIDAETGKVLWNVGSARNVVCRNGDKVIVSAGTQLQLVATDSGAVLETVTLPTHTRALLNTEDETLYAVSRLGTVLCAKPQGHPYLTPEVVALAKRELHSPLALEAGEEGESELKPRSPNRSEVLDWDDPLRSTTGIPPLAGQPEKGEK
jgi:outer membrane protein assembly factor BamB